MESSTPIPKTIVPIIAVKTLTPTPPNLISKGCQRTTAPTAAIVNIANLGDLNKNAMAIKRINIVQIVVRLCALCTPSLMSIDTGNPPVNSELYVSSIFIAVHLRAPEHSSSPSKISSIAFR